MLPTSASKTAQSSKHAQIVKADTWTGFRYVLLRFMFTASTTAVDSFMKWIKGIAVSSAQSLSLQETCSGVKIVRGTVSSWE